MRYYELLYIVNPNIEDDRVKNIIDEIGNEVGKYKVSIINHYIWGKKRLAYPINKNKYGIYILMQFSAEQFDFLKNFERFLILDKAVIRHQIVRLDDEPTKVEDIESVVDETEPLKKESFEIPEDDSVVDHEAIEEVQDVNDANVKETESEEEIKEEIE
ncbi:MAG: 30S ribosomal protein S6 [Candidatus Marinimicrobia bacterium]|jgi:small subunit ribosomal protein S6|nr:30S ribosomal protein S6 [Candidatus Neomarinimicrobiota bacterium]